MINRKTLLALTLAAALLLGGCNYYTTADAAYHIIVTAVTTGEAELPVYLNAGITSPAENAVLDSFYHTLLTLATTMDACNAQAKTVNTKAAYIACMQPMAAALANPATLAGLRVINPQAQARVQVVIIAVVGGINVVMQAWAAAVPAPTVTTAVPAADIRNFEYKVMQNYMERSR